MEWAVALADVFWVGFSEDPASLSTLLMGQSMRMPPAIVPLCCLYLPLVSVRVANYGDLEVNVPDCEPTDK